jgi:hypothetical protein
VDKLLRDVDGLMARYEIDDQNDDDEDEDATGE